MRAVTAPETILWQRSRWLDSEQGERTDVRTLLLVKKQMYKKKEASCLCGKIDFAFSWSLCTQNTVFSAR